MGITHIKSGSNTLPGKIQQSSVGSHDYQTKGTRAVCPFPPPMFLVINLDTGGQGC